VSEPTPTKKLGAVVNGAPGRARLYDDWEDACRASPHRKAVSASGRVRYNGKYIRAEITKPLHGDGTVSFPGFGIPLRKATPAEVDSVRIWKPF
jgi:hypothetical protein